MISCDLICLHPLLTVPFREATSVSSTSFFPTVRGHQSFVGALAGRPSRFEALTRPDGRERRLPHAVDLAPPPR